MYINTASTTVLLIINILILGYSLWINKLIFKSYKYISLPVIFNLFFFAFHILVYAYVVYSGNETFYFLRTSNYIYPVKAAVLSTICIVMFNIGTTLFYFKKIKFNLNIIPIRQFSNNKMLKIGIMALCIGVIAKLTFFLIFSHGNLFYYFTHYYQIQLENASGGAGSEKYLNLLTSLIEIGAYIIYIEYLKTKKHLWIVITSLFAFLLNFNSRTSLILAVVSYAIITALFNENFRKNLKNYTIIVFIPIIVFITLALGQFRDSTNNTSWEGKNRVYYTIAVSHNIRALSDYLEYKSSFKRQYGKAIILPLIQKPIPRKIWKNKQYSSSMMYTDIMMPGALESGGGIAAGLCFDLILNFGMIGMFLGFIFIGYLTTIFAYSVLALKILPYKDDFYIVLYSTIASSLFYIRGNDITISLYNYSMTLIPLLCIFLAVNIFYDKNKNCNYKQLSRRTA